MTEPPQGQPPPPTAAGQPQPAQGVQPPVQPPPPRQPGKWAGLLILMAVILVVSLGGYVVPGGSAAGELTGGEIELGRPVVVAGGITIQPAAGWGVIQEALCGEGVILGNGTANLLVAAGPGESPEAIIVGYTDSCLRPDALQLTIAESVPTTLPAGPAAGAPYIGVFQGFQTPIEGELIGVVSPSGQAVILDGWAGEGLYRSVRDEIIAMASSLRIA